MDKDGSITIPQIPFVEGQKTHEYVYARLRYAIMTGAIEPGTNLTMRGLAEAFGLSPTPIREAVRQLSSENAVNILPNRRISLPRMTLGRFEELVALQITLEVHAAERALPYISDIIIEEMVHIDDEMDAAIANGDHNAPTTLNHDFHRKLYVSNPNQVSIPVMESVWLQLGPFQRQVTERARDLSKVDRHKEILTALRARDVAALMIATENDVRDGISRSGRRLLTSKTA